MKKVFRLNENDIEKLVKKIIREDEESTGMQKPKEDKSIELLQTNNGELSSVEDIIQMVSNAGQKFGGLCQQVTGNDGFAKEIDGMRRQFLGLQNKLLDSKEKIAKFVQQKNAMQQKDHMRKKKEDYMRRKEDAMNRGKYYA